MTLPDDTSDPPAGKAMATIDRAPVFAAGTGDAELQRMLTKAAEATNFLKTIGHEGRIMILCHLATGEKSVTQLESLLGARQAAISQQLSRLRMEGLVQPRRDGKTIYYSLSDDRPGKLMELIYDMFCRTGEDDD